MQWDLPVVDGKLEVCETEACRGIVECPCCNVFSYLTQGYLLFYDEEGKDEFVQVELGPSATEYSEFRIEQPGTHCPASLSRLSPSSSCEIPKPRHRLPLPNLRLQQCRRESTDGHCLHRHAVGWCVSGWCQLLTSNRLCLSPSLPNNTARTRFFSRGQRTSRTQVSGNKRTSIREVNTPGVQPRIIQGDEQAAEEAAQATEPSIASIFGGTGTWKPPPRKPKPPPPPVNIMSGSGEVARECPFGALTSQFFLCA